MTGDRGSHGWLLGAPFVTPDKFEGLDAELIQLCAQALEMETEYRRIVYDHDDDTASRMIEETGDTYDKLRKQIEVTKALTVEGIQAKCAAFYAHWHPSPDPGSEMAWGIVIDMLNPELKTPTTPLRRINWSTYPD